MNLFLFILRNPLKNKNKNKHNEAVFSWRNVSTYYIYLHTQLMEFYIANDMSKIDYLSQRKKCYLKETEMQELNEINAEKKILNVI